MKMGTLLAMLLFSCTEVFAQVSLNLDMEVLDKVSGLPKGWLIVGQNSKHYFFHSDSMHKQSGKYSLSLETNDPDPFRTASATLILRAPKAGNKLTLNGFIKADSVSNGYVGLGITVFGERLGNRRTWIAGNDMAQQQVKGTFDWKAFSLNVSYDQEEADSIAVYLILTGTGKVWFDNFSVLVDGKDLALVPEKPVHVYPARLDTVFRKSSGLSSFTLEKVKIANLTNLGMLWGFLKYHHPLIAKGNYNWDAELFRIASAVLAATNKAAANKVFENWVDKIGLPEKCTKCSEIKKGSGIKLMPDYADLFKKDNLSASLIKKLEYILLNRSSGKHYYITMSSASSGWPIFKENAYSEMVYPDAGYRLLALYRFWNVIQYFSPNRHLIKEDWPKVLADFIPKFIHATDSLSYTLSCAALAARIHDSHALFFNKTLDDYFGNYYAPVQTRFIENELVVTSYHVADSNLRKEILVGDIVSKIDGIPIKERFKQAAPFLSSSNYDGQLRNARGPILRGQTPNVVFEILRDGKNIAVNVNRVTLDKINPIYTDPYPKDSGFKVLPNNIGFIYPAKLKNADFEKIKKSFNSTKGIIIDFRCYPSAFMPFMFVPWFKSDSSAFVKSSHASLSTPGLFTYSPELKNGRPNNDYYRGKVVIIVNEITQSSAEYQTMALQSAPNVVVIGSTTAGADGNTSYVDLPGNIRVNISAVGVYYPDGTETQRSGIRIDQSVRPTIKGIQEGRDELMEKAVDIVEGGNGSRKK